MTLTTHATVGAVIGYAIGEPLAGFVLGFLSHLLLDMIPHGDYRLGRDIRKSKAHLKKAIGFITLDAIVAIFFILWLVSWKDLMPIQAISWAVVGAILPDLFVGLYDVTKSKWFKPLNTIHFHFHDMWHKKRKDMSLGHALIIQAIMIMLIQTQL